MYCGKVVEVDRVVLKQFLYRHNGFHVKVESMFIGGGGEYELGDVLVRDLVEVSERESDDHQKSGGDDERETDFFVGGQRRRPIAETGPSVDRYLVVILNVYV